MLTELEFQDKIHIVLDKSMETYIMNRVGTYWDRWLVISIRKNVSYENGSEIDRVFMDDSDAYAFYKERMQSYGFKQFPIIEE